jgi:hypothetical protein
MNDRQETGVRLEFSNGRPTITDVADINRVRAAFYHLKHDRITRARIHWGIL